MTTKPFYKYTFKFQKSHLVMRIKADEYEEALQIAVDASKFIRGDFQYLGLRTNKQK